MSGSLHSAIHSCCLSALKIKISFTLYCIQEHSENISNMVLRTSLSPKAGLCILNWLWTQSKFLPSLFCFILPFYFPLDIGTIMTLHMASYIVISRPLAANIRFNLKAAPNQ